MNRGIKSHSDGLLRFSKVLAVGTVLLLPRFGNFEAGAGVVTECTDTNLRIAIVGGGTVTFACDGTIPLVDTITVITNTTIDGTSHQITVSGGNAVRVFSVATNVSLTLVNVTIAEGCNTNGAGILNTGGTVTLQGVVFRENHARITRPATQGEGWDQWAPEGGAILNIGGIVNATNCTFCSNAALVTPDQFLFGDHRDTRGGAIRNVIGLINLMDCDFTGNGTCGSPGISEAGAVMAGGRGLGGAIHNSGSAHVVGCRFVQNYAVGGAGKDSGINPFTDTGWNGSDGGSGLGGAIYNSDVLVVESSAFLNNAAQGSRGGNSGPRGMVMDPFPPDGAADGIAGGAGGAAMGGAICNFGILATSNSVFATNRCVAGQGGEGGEAGYESLPDYNAYGTGGKGGTGGSSLGGAVFNSGTASLVNVTVSMNAGTGANGGDGGGAPTLSGPTGAGGAAAGGIYDANGYLSITNCTLASNRGIPGTGVANGWAVGGIQTAGALLINSLLASNHPGNCSGFCSDLGHNLSSDATGAFTNIGSLNNIDPILAPLADKGGLTLTMALLPGSPAIDAGDDAAAPPTDQRGVSRPVGAASDIGAYECSAPVLTTLPPTQTAEVGSDVDFTAATVGDPAMAYLWYFNGSDLISCTTDGDAELTDAQLSHAGSYTLVVTNMYGAVTSAPVMLDVIAPVERRPVPAVSLFGQTGELLRLDYRDSLGSGADWASLDTLTLSNPAQFYFDLTTPLPRQRFYRSRQTVASSDQPVLDLHMVPAITLAGTVGEVLRLDYINAIGPTDAWVMLDVITLTNTSQFYFDASSIGQPKRLYRIVPVP